MDGQKVGERFKTKRKKEGKPISEEPDCTWVHGLRVQNGEEQTLLI